MRYVAAKQDQQAVHFLRMLSQVAPTAKFVVLESVDEVRSEDVYICSLKKADPVRDQHIGERIALADSAIHAGGIGTRRIIIYKGDKEDGYLTSGRLVYTAGIVTGMLRGRFPRSELWGIPYQQKVVKIPSEIHAWATPYAH